MNGSTSLQREDGYEKLFEVIHTQMPDYENIWKQS